MKICITLACLKISLTLCVCVSTAVSRAASGSITSGAVVTTPAPASLIRNAFENDTTIALIQERENFVLPNSVTLDADGTPGRYGQLSDLTGGILASGALVDVHLLHFDPVGTPFTPVRVSGSVTFHRPIIGMVFRLDTLNATDAYGAPGTIYPTAANPIFRDFEFGAIGAGVSDSAEISPNRLTLSLNWGATEYIDQLRVFTAVPEPRTMALLGSLTLMWIARNVTRQRGRVR
ncbi:MAG: hypothetical protein WD851_19715 [Pirellulales bacterium]